MASVPSKAQVVVIGAGIVGNSLVYHLARLGWRNIVQVEKGPLPNPARKGQKPLFDGLFCTNACFCRQR